MVPRTALALSRPVSACEQESKREQGKAWRWLARRAGVLVLVVEGVEQRQGQDRGQVQGEQQRAVRGGC